MTFLGVNRRARAFQDNRTGLVICIQAHWQAAGELVRDRSRVHPQRTSRIPTLAPSIGRPITVFAYGSAEPARLA